MHRQDYLFRVNTAYLFKKHRVDRGLTLAQAKAITGVPPNAISRVESRVHFATVETYARLQRGYGFAYRKVFREYNSEPTNKQWKVLNARAQTLGANARWETRRKRETPLTIKKKRRSKVRKDEFMGHW